MACYKNETKHKCSKVVMVVSILALVMGFLTAVFGFMKSGGADDLLKDAKKKYNEATENEDEGSKDDDFNFGEDLGIPTDSAVGALIIVGGVLTIITGVFGGLTVKFKKVYFAVPFVGMAFCVALFLLIGGFIALAPAGELVTEGCKFFADEAKGPGFDAGQEYENLVDINMCSDACKCDEAHKDKWTADTMTAGQQGVRPADQLVWAPAGDGVFDNFKACFDAAATAGKDIESAAAGDKAKAWMKENGSKALGALEDLYKDTKCAGMCKTPVFYWSRSLADGPPETDCFKAAVEAMSDGTGPAGAVAILSALALIVAGIGGFPLCTGFNDKKDDQ